MLIRAQEPEQLAYVPLEQRRRRKELGFLGRAFTFAKLAAKFLGLPLLPNRPLSTHACC